MREAEVQLPPSLKSVIALPRESRLFIYSALHSNSLE